MSEKVMNRWWVVPGAILVQLCLGAIYAWSAFTDKLTASPFNFTKTQTQIIFSVGLASFAVIMALFAGRWQKRLGSRLVALIGGLIVGIGYIIGGLAGASFWGILIGVGLLGGTGIGLGYVCPIATCVKWFPDKKGLITGLAVAGFGFGALIWIKLTSGFVFGPIDLTPGWKGLYGAGMSVNQVFILYGIIFAILVSLGSLVLVDPPQGWSPAGWTQKAAAKASALGSVEMTAGQMAKTGAFWGLFVCFMVCATAGLMVIGIIKLFGTESLTMAGLSPEKAGVIAGTAMGLFYSLLNGLGRIIWGSVSDRLGRKNSIALMCGLQGLTMLAFSYLASSEIGLYLAAAMIGFNFGGNFALFPAATADLFGNKNVGSNYPWVFLAYGVGGIVGPILGGMMGDVKAWNMAFLPAGTGCLVAAGIALSLTSPNKQEG